MSLRPRLFLFLKSKPIYAVFMLKPKAMKKRSFKQKAFFVKFRYFDYDVIYACTWTWFYFQTVFENILEKSLTQCQAPILKCASHKLSFFRFLFEVQQNHHSKTKQKGNKRQAQVREAIRGNSSINSRLISLKSIFILYNKFHTL